LTHQIFYVLSKSLTENGMNREEFRTWREKFGLTQPEAATKFGVSRNTIQNWETGATPLPQTIEGACEVWEDRLKKGMAEIGPVTLIYANGPLFIDAYGPSRPRASMTQEAYPTNAAALARVQKLWGGPDFHGPFIIEKSGKPLWNQVELLRVVDGSNKDAPTLFNTITRFAEYVRENSHLHARDGARTWTGAEREKAKVLTEQIADELDLLASKAPDGTVRYEDVEALVLRLRAIGFYPTNRIIGDIAHAVQGNEIAAAA
jgi:transcriptional regulator with XRE-family HTH domain